jgi:dTDP-glucose 4,6-dehydratase
MTNIEIVKKIISICDKKLGRKEGESLKLITYVSDRKGHDLRYAICADKLKNDLGWEPSKDFDDGISETIDYYLIPFSQKDIK